MPQGERNGDSLNTLFRKILGYILRYVLDYYFDTRRKDVNDPKKQGTDNWNSRRPIICLDIDNLRMQGICNGRFSDFS